MTIQHVEAILAEYTEAHGASKRHPKPFDLDALQTALAGTIEADVTELVKAAGMVRKYSREGANWIHARACYLKQEEKNRLFRDGQPSAICRYISG